MTRRRTSHPGGYRAASGVSCVRGVLAGRLRLELPEDISASSSALPNAALK